MGSVCVIWFTRAVYFVVSIQCVSLVRFLERLNAPYVQNLWGESSDRKTYLKIDAVTYLFEVLTNRYYN